MQTTVNSQTLAAELRLINKIIPSKPVMQVLGYVQLTARESVLKFWATDLDIGLALQCPAEVREEGSVMLPAVMLLQLIEQFPDADVMLKTDGQKVIVKCGAFTTKLQTIPTSGCIEQTAVEGDANTLDSNVLRQAITQTRYAINSVAAQYILKGALLELTGQNAVMVTTDGKRLAMVLIKQTGADISATIPAQTLDVLLAQTDTGPVELRVGSRHLFFSSGTRLLISKQLVGSFPKYKAIIPRDNAHVAKVDRAGLAAALRRIRLIAELNKAIYLKFDADSLGLTTASAGVGDASEALRISYTGPSMTLCLNGDFVLDFLEVATGQTITMSMRDEKSAVLLADGPSYLGVVMTMSL